MFDVTLADGVCRLSRPDTRFCSTGFDGGTRVADAAFNITVPEEWDDEGDRDLAAYVADRVDRAGFEPASDAPALLTGVDQTHARRARLGPVEVVATAGVSNPAALPVETDGAPALAGADTATAAAPTEEDADAPSHEDAHPSPGTVNLLVGTTRACSPGALANLVAVAAEAKAATLLALAGVPGTTSDAVVVGCDPDGEPAAFSGSATAVGAATRACVRDAVAASLASRYGPETDAALPDTVSDATYGVVTDERARVGRVDEKTSW
ncbi:adenosylcobinamide amidohydrolase [Halorubrum gandharaense]